MPNYKVKGHFELEIEDVATPEEAKQEALSQLADCMIHYPAETALDVKVEEIPATYDKHDQVI
jgi:hypothetical protein